jgi:hypothetical protein
MANKFTTIAIALSLLTFSQFGLLDAIGIRRESQFLLISFAVLGILSTFKFNYSQFTDYTKWLFFIGFYLLTKDIDKSISLGFLYSLLIFLYLSGNNNIQIFLKYLMIIMTFFSILGIFQFILVNFIPEASHSIALFNDTYLNGDNFVLFSDGPYGHDGFEYLRLLGFGDGSIINFSIFTFTRLRSFLHEPSLMAPYFLAPSLIALTYNLGIRRLAYINITFCFLSFSGMVYLVFAIGFSIYFLTKLRMLRLGYYFIFGFLMLSYFYIYNNIPPLESGLGENDYLLYIKNIENGLISEDSSKFSSFYSRAGGISYAEHLISQNFLLGSSINVRSPIGLFLWSSLYGGLIGFILIGINIINLFRKLYNLLTNKFLDNDRMQLLFCCIFSLLLQIYFFNDYGFTTPFGLILVLLFNNRINQISSELLAKPISK